MKIIKLLDRIPVIDEDDTSPVLVFDIDGTLYKEFPELVEARRRGGYNLFKKELTELDFELFHKLSSEYSKKYGANYKGFILHHNVTDDLISQVDDIRADLDGLLKVNEDQMDILRGIKYKKMVFTNCNKAQAEYVLEKLGLVEHIDTMFCVGYTPNKEILLKPTLKAYEFVTKAISQNSKRKIFFFDDNIKNVEGARNAGWIAVHVPNADEIGDLVVKTLKEHNL